MEMHVRLRVVAGSGVGISSTALRPDCQTPAQWPSSCIVHGSSVAQCRLNETQRPGSSCFAILPKALALALALTLALAHPSSAFTGLDGALVGSRDWVRVVYYSLPPGRRQAATVDL